MTVKSPYDFPMTSDGDSLVTLFFLLPLSLMFFFFFVLIISSSSVWPGA